MPFASLAEPGDTAACNQARCGRNTIGTAWRGLPWWSAAKCHIFIGFFVCKSKNYVTLPPHTVGIAQLVRAPDCGSGGRRFEPDYLPERPS